MHQLRRFFLVCVILTGFADPAAAQNRAALDSGFDTWRDNELWPEARQHGISRDTYATAFNGVRPNLSLPDLRLPGKDGGGVVRQSEFRSPAAYFSEKRLNSLVSAGRAIREKWSTTLLKVEQTYGVSARIVLAIWGRESDYGRARIPHNAIRALATQAYVGRRKTFFRGELIAALRILQEGHVSPAALKSSWAGGLGHPQFLPSAFHKYAVDFDGDGRRDIWRSVPDALASIANFLKKNGWQSGRDWGFESHVPSIVSCTLEGPDQGRPIAGWVDAGVQRVLGRKFAAAELRKTGFLLMPAGRFGPAYIVTENFYVLKRYNESDLYALFIGHLADRYGGNRRFAAKWHPVGGFTRNDVQQMQQRLESLGYDVGGADGLIGFRTRVAVGTWQARAGRKPTCFPSAKEVSAIR